jgi:hypothetical protein
MGYTEKNWMVRADRFKASGKWYDMFALDMEGLYGADQGAPLIHEAVCRALNAQVLRTDHPHPESGWFVVVLEPYHEHAHPIVAWGRRDGTWGNRDD